MKAALIALLLSSSLSNADGSGSKSGSRSASKSGSMKREKRAKKDPKKAKKEKGLGYVKKEKGRPDLLPGTPADSTCIQQSDFATGTLIINKPGAYRLCEDITFNPNPPSETVPPCEAFTPEFGDVYDENSFGLGFFAAIAIAADGVDLYLNGHTLEQSKGHALIQRFYANIELNNSPFIAGAGPAQFVGDGDTFHPSSYVRILGPGKLGRSSHHGIHGNNNANIEISNVAFEDFEVAAISLNNADGVQIRDNTVIGNRKDVPVTGMFSAAHFISPYGAVLKELGYKMELRGQRVSAEQLYHRLVKSINKVYNDVVNGEGFIDQVKHPEEFELFDNPFRVVDGPCYAFLVHGIGPAVGGQGMIFDEDPDRCSSNIVIESNRINDITCWTKEIPAAVVDGTVQNDARGAVFQWVDTVTGKGIAMNDDGTYKGNVVADMQVMVAKAIHDGVLNDTDALQTGVNTIDTSVVEWAANPVLTFEPKYRCGGDVMHHVNKGIIAIRVEDTQGFDIAKNKIKDIQSVGVEPFGACTDYHAGQSPENAGMSQLGDVRVISIAATREYDDNRDCTIHRNHIEDVGSSVGDVVIGVDIQGQTKGIDISNNQVDLKAKRKESVEYIGLRIRKNVDGSSIDIERNNRFKDGVQNLTTARRLRNPFSGAPHGHIEGIEWENGGCPFAKKRGNAPRH